jgi:ABC-2 type transport system ATP-binding protein
MPGKDIALERAIYAHDLTRSFGELVAVDHLNFVAPTGIIFGFLGLNGAGKTTTIKMLTGLLQPTAGTAVVAGYDVLTHPIEVKRHIGVLLEEDGLYDRLTGLEYLQFVAAMHGLGGKETRSRIDGLLASLDLMEKQKELVAAYSKGMRRKLSLAAALVHRPPLLIADEPFAGVDALSIRTIKALLRDLRDSGTTILLSSHLLAVAQDVCDQIAIIHRGRIAALGDLPALQREAKLENTSSLEDVFVHLVQQASPVAPSAKV